MDADWVGARLRAMIAPKGAPTKTKIAPKNIRPEIVFGGFLSLAVRSLG